MMTQLRPISSAEKRTNAGDGFGDMTVTVEILRSALFSVVIRHGGIALSIRAQIAPV
jgi:hypothetical protein